MKSHVLPLNARFFAAALVLLAVALPSMHGREIAAQVERSVETRTAIHHVFNADDEALLTEIQRGCFEFLWKEVGSPVPLVKDRLTNDKVSSLAGVGFQLTALPIGVERGWIDKQQGAQRATKILSAILERGDNKKHGIYLHYVDLNTGGMHYSQGAQVQASTVDHALLQAGAMAVAVYFGGEVNELTNQIIEQANWKAYEVDLHESILPKQSGEPEKFISFGWRPDDEGNDLSVAGSLRPWSWYKASAEEHLVTFLAVGSPDPQHAVAPDMYYRLHRVFKRHRDLPIHAVSWGGQAFTYFFAHCWIDYRGFGPDDPQAFGVEKTPVDWFENSRRALLTHRQRCLESANQYKTFGPNRWGMSPAADINHENKISYIVQSVQPCMEGRDNFCKGTVTPYAAGSAIMFLPELSVAALREFRHLKDDAGRHVVWRELDKGGYGLLDSFNLDRQERQGTPDYLSIDDGPMIVAIENARTGLIWNLFMQHPSAKLAVKRLKWKPLSP